MSKIAIITDSTAYIPETLCQQYNITMLPQILIWGKETFYDGVDIRPKEFYQRLSTDSVMPTSSQISPGTFQKTFQQALDDGYEVLAVLISEKLSGTLSSARQARATLPENAPIKIVDSRSTVMAMGFQVLQAARAIEKGANLQEARQIVENARLRSGAVFAPSTLEFLHRGGRIGGASRLLGTAFNIKPILNLEEGRIEPLEKVRTFKRAQQRMIEIVSERAQGAPIHLAIIHANAPDQANELLAQARQKLNIVEDMIGPVSPVIGAHVGPGLLGIAYLIEA